MSDFTESIDEDARRQFESDWKSNSLKDIESYLPEPSDSRYWPTLEELLYIDLEFSWKEYQKLPTDETISVHKSPTERLKTISRRLNLAQKKDLLDRLNDFEKSLREKSRREVPKSDKRVHPPSAKDEYETLPIDGAHTAPLTKGNTPNLESRQEFGDYLLLEMLGRGGMGVVFRAQEKKTGRHVALKMIRSNIVNRVDEETQRVVIERFQTEAKAVANLEHPNIVTLYEVGQQDDTPYISMQLVQGEDLASTIRQSVLESKTAARYMKTVAEAIHAVHEQGMIHRDLKPHNILLNEMADQPLVTDFGLAKLTDDANGVTETGELLGTPGYMSPEQARGETVGPASDVYSLGATLYCLIGGRAPFQAADTMKTIEQIVKNPPIEPREVNPDVDLDLNTICLKCLEKDPARRYESAQDLAEDLDRYLKCEPIKARPIGAVEKSIRWCKRNPLPTTIVVALLLIACVSLIGYFVAGHFSRKNQSNYTLAYESNKEELFLITENSSLKLPGMRGTRESLLLPLRDFFEEFIELNGDFRQVRSEFAFAHFALGKIAFELGDSDEALEQLGQAIQMQQDLVKQKPKDAALQLDLSNSLNLRGECLLKLDFRENSQQDFDAAHKIREQLAKDFPDDLEYHRKLANTEMNLGNCFAHDGEKESEKQAIRHYQLSMGMRDALLKQKELGSEIRFEAQRDQAKCLFNLSLSQVNLEERDLALASAKSSLDIFAALHDQRPHDLFVVRDKARCAKLLLELDEVENRLAYFAEISAAYQHIVRLYPEEKEYCWLAVRSLTAQGNYELLANELPSARESFLQAYESVVNEVPTNNNDRMALVDVCLGLIPIHLKATENSEVKFKLQLAKTLMKELTEANHPGLELNRQRLEEMEKIVNQLLGPDL